jgi:hypothetical protein
MNRFQLRRVEEVVDMGAPELERWDLVVPVIDGAPLADRLVDRAPGTWAQLVTPPSRHWLGQPEEDRFDDADGRAEVMTGGCGEAGCCGVFARITIHDDTVTWEDFSARGAPDITEDLSFTFDRSEYEAAIANL